MSKTPRLPSQLHGELQRGVVAEYAHAQLSRVNLPSTCYITHVTTYTTLIIFLGKGSRGTRLLPSTNN